MPSKTSQSRNSASILAQGFLRSSMFSTAYQHNLHPFRRYISFALLGITLVTSAGLLAQDQAPAQPEGDRKSTRLNSSHSQISYAVFCLKKKKIVKHHDD